MEDNWDINPNTGQRWKRGDKREDGFTFKQFGAKKKDGTQTMVFIEDWEAHKAKEQEAQKKWRQNNPEKFKASQDKWKQKNPEKYRDAQRRAAKKYREKNPEKFAEAQRKWRAANPDAQNKWRQNNPEKFKASQDKWKQKNPEKYRDAQRRAAKKYRIKSPEKAAESQRKWKEENPEAYAESRKKAMDRYRGRQYGRYLPKRINPKTGDFFRAGELNEEGTHYFKQYQIEADGCFRKEQWVSLEKRLKHFCKQQFNKARQRAMKQQVPFDIDADYLLSIFPKNNICPVFGEPMVFFEGRNWATASLDKFYPKKGYVKGNVHFISMQANQIKTNATTEEVEMLANWMERFEKENAEASNS
jgi:hypothetical protein